MMRFTFFDTETTGLPLPRTAPLEKQPRICEMGILVFDTEQMAVVQEYSQLINPGIPMPPEVIKIHGITDEMVATAPTFEQAWAGADGLEPMIPLFFDSIDFIVAHNAPFDTGLLNFEFARMGLGCSWALPTAICTVQEYRHLFGKFPKLVDLYRHFTGKEYDHKHRAIDDTRALLEACLAAKFFDTFVEPKPIGENHYEVAAAEFQRTGVKPVGYEDVDFSRTTPIEIKEP